MALLKANHNWQVVQSELKRKLANVSHVNLTLYHSILNVLSHQFSCIFCYHGNYSIWTLEDLLSYICHSKSNTCMTVLVFGNLEMEFQDEKTMPSEYVL